MIRNTSLRHAAMALALAGGALSCAGVAMAAPHRPALPDRANLPDRASLIAAEDRLFAAQAAHDLSGIAAGFAEDALFMHANGMHQSKAEFIAAVRDGTLNYKSVTASDRVALVSGTLGVTRGTMHLVVGEMHLSGTYLAAYVLRDGRWQMLDWQSTPPLSHD